MLAGIRKLIERDELAGSYRTLKFHCDWALHARMDRASAQELLRLFDAAHPYLKVDMELAELPRGLGTEIDNISRMRVFERELEQFLGRYGLPPLTHRRSDGWTFFLQLYTQVIADIPLVVTAGRQSGRRTLTHISSVTVLFERAIKLTENGERFFKVRWQIHDRDGESGEVFVLNSYSERALPTGAHSQ